MLILLKVVIFNKLLQITLLSSQLIGQERNADLKKYEVRSEIDLEKLPYFLGNSKLNVLSKFQYYTTLNS